MLVSDTVKFIDVGHYFLVGAIYEQACRSDREICKLLSFIMQNYIRSSKSLTKHQNVSNNSNFQVAKFNPSQKQEASYRSVMCLPSTYNGFALKIKSEKAVLKMFEGPTLYNQEYLYGY